MNFKNFRISHFLPNFIISILYPVARYFTAEEKNMVAALDALTIIGMMGILIGIINNLYLHGDFDITRYFLSQKLNNQRVSFSKYIADERAKEKDSFNYPLFVGILLVVISLIGAELFC